MISANGLMFFCLYFVYTIITLWIFNSILRKIEGGKLKELKKRRKVNFQKPLPLI